MTIDKVRLYRYEVPFVRPFKTAQSILQNRSGLVFEAVNSDGLVGYGEAAPLAGFSRETIEECIASARHVIGELRGQHVPLTPGLLRQLANEFLGAPSCVVFGLETLLADMAAQISGVAMANWFRADASGKVALNAVITGEIGESQVKAKIAEGFSTFKLKIGSLSVDDDFRRITMVRHLIGPDRRLRLDANRAYDSSMAAHLFHNIEPLGIEYVEEPLQNSEPTELAQLRRDFAVPVAIDESLIEMSNQGTDSAASLLQDDAKLRSFDVAIIKPSQLGSINRTLDLGERLMQAGKRVVITSALDGGIAVTAALQIACALRVQSACGLDTAGLLQVQLIDVASFATDGAMARPDRSGLGVKLSSHPSALNFLTEINVD